MTPAAMAALYARGIEGRAWREAEISRLLSSIGVFSVAVEAGFAIGRCVLDDVELLTIVVDPNHRREGAGRALLAAFEDAARQRGTRYAHLEVAEDNRAARALYTAHGYWESGRRRGYYKRTNGAVDAILMSKTLDIGP